MNKPVSTIEELRERLGDKQFEQLIEDIRKTAISKYNKRLEQRLENLKKEARLKYNKQLQQRIEDLRKEPGFKLARNETLALIVRARDLVTRLEMMQTRPGRRVSAKKKSESKSSRR
jgi:HPt (histidine-containing phosphotransfer) domain-containing protein